MLMLIGMLGIVYLVGTRFGNEAGAVAVLVMAGILVVIFAVAWHQDSKAYGNWVDYWASGGPEGERRREAERARRSRR